MKTSANTWHERLNNLLRNIASPNLAVWQHIVRREESTYPGGEFPDGFAKDLNARYAERVSGEVLMTNELYLTLVYRPQTSNAGRTVFRVFSKADPTARAAEREEAVEFLDRVATEVLSSLDRYDPERLASISGTAPAIPKYWNFSGFWSTANGSPCRCRVARSMTCWRPRARSSARKRLNCGCPPRHATAACWRSTNTPAKLSRACSIHC